MEDPLVPEGLGFRDSPDERAMACKIRSLR